MFATENVPILPPPVALTNSTEYTCRNNLNSLQDHGYGYNYLIQFWDGVWKD
jgi:hypothetical protein